MASKNTIFVIKPYFLNGLWVFDEPTLGLKAEAFVAGSTEIISKMVRRKGIKNAKRGFTLVFSDKPFPDHDFVLSYESGEATNGTWYNWEITGMRGWLCSQLSSFWSRSPKKIFCQLLQ